MKEETYPVEITRKQMQDFKTLFEHIRGDYPFIPSSLSKLYGEFMDIFRNGCFKHRIMTETFQTSYNSSTTICRKCNPKEYKELKKENEKNEMD